MKTVIVLGSGNSGAGAIHDYLLSREDFQSPFAGKEFRIVNDPDGLNELHDSLYKNFNINNASNKLNNFTIFARNYLKSNYNKKHKIITNEFLDLTNLFVNEITKIEYNGSPQFYFDKMNFINKINFYIKRFIFRKPSKEVELLKMIIPKNENVFLSACENYLKEIFKLNSNFDSSKNIVIEQGGNFLSPISSTKLYGKNKKVVCVTRNPNAIFWSMKRRNSLAYPGHDIKIFVEWYKSIMQKIKIDEFKNITHVKFEDFFSDFENQKKNLCLKLNIDPNVEDTFDLEFTKKNLFKFKDNLSTDEINFINSELKEFI